MCTWNIVAVCYGTALPRRAASVVAGPHIQYMHVKGCLLLNCIAASCCRVVLPRCGKIASTCAFGKLFAAELHCRVVLLRRAAASCCRVVLP